jgi:diguanylate cyclase
MAERSTRPRPSERKLDDGRASRSGLAMKTESLIELRWAALMQDASPAAKQLLMTISARHAPEFAATFYEVMLRDPDARGFLAGEEMTARLRESMRRWLGDILTRWEPSAIPELIATQRQMGAVHARIGVRIELIMRGTRLLKQTIIDALLGNAVSNDHLEAAKVAIEMVNMAVEIMAHQYTASSEVEARKDEAYRNYAASVNMSVERERQRAAIFSWQTELLQCVVVGSADEPLPPISKSSFGLWLRHKATSIFSTDAEFHEVVQAAERIDACLALFRPHEPPRGGSDASKKLISLILNEARRIQTLMETMFERLINLESGRDALTQLLSRRFQSTILSREIELSRNSGKPFAVLLLDIDHFKSVNDTYGHEAGDRVLQHIAGVLTGNVRSGDFIFRHGGEEFMILCVEVTAKEAMVVADKIRAAVQGEKIEISDKIRLSVTTSVGVASYDGHPDYLRLVARADEALYEAKNSGRNNCMLAA